MQHCRHSRGSAFVRGMCGGARSFTRDPQKYPVPPTATTTTAAAATLTPTPTQPKAYPYCFFVIVMCFCGLVADRQYNPPSSMNEQEIALPYSQPTTEQHIEHKLKAGGCGGRERSGEGRGGRWGGAMSSSQSATD
jgi:hypothetical protein